MKIDPQIISMAGEFLTVGKLFKRGYQASITFGNAKSIDIFVYNSAINKTFNVQVKTLQSRNCFRIKKERIHSDHIYIFVVLNDFEVEEEFFIVKGQDILEDIETFFGSSYKHDKPSAMPAINYGPLKKYQDNWNIFDNV